ncbi:DUF2335 domain-containing protein [Salmonella enterica]|uniref:DUF2335 domain-containing protein n=1 Tax=Salmonella enterica subsp. enterica serovar Bareilly TaxID=58096 RepID=A0A5U9SD33_SALET|nr:DUF2335 domain-containing protein [Salmonella enterica]EAB9748898.1 DUF2335 domain-containing protein [Salmonella enterica subsp. salamae]EBS4094378.1 DUF2335 domain-containing protein [Salmonella enterica subsp. enterica serovar Bareilly]EBZ2213604.1 DUF2335 domain-containing protein [Salmonella enterica subsp. enterica serovar Montevideo]ECD4584679.1 DUF2335 domain-containing protein [Salmonella enterica subsp. enterica serovar Newport]ECI2684847.1 DUF2335 domain-containing protein [Salmo
MSEQKESENADLTCEEQKTNELVSRVIENPEVLNRVLDTPQGQAIVCRHFQGPVPSPSMLKEYEQLMPGLANRLVELTEKEQAHRHKTVSDSIDVAKSGQRKAFWIAIAIIFAAVLFGVRGQTGLAGTIITVDLVALVSAFIAGKHYSKKQDMDQE